MKHAECADAPGTEPGAVNARAGPEIVTAATGQRSAAVISLMSVVTQPVNVSPAIWRRP